MRICMAMLVLVGVTLATGCDNKQEYKESQDIAQAPPCATAATVPFVEETASNIEVRVLPAACDEGNTDTAELAKDEFCQERVGARCEPRDCQASLPGRLCKGDFLNNESTNVTVDICRPVAGVAPLPSGRVRCGCTVRLQAGGRAACGCRCRE